MLSSDEVTHTSDALGPAVPSAITQAPRFSSLEDAYTLVAITLPEVGGLTEAQTKQKAYVLRHYPTPSELSSWSRAEKNRHTPEPSLQQLLDRYDPDAAYAAEDRAWLNMAPIGREFGSPDYDRLMAQDAKVFAAKPENLSEQCSPGKESANDGNNLLSAIVEYLQNPVPTQLIAKLESSTVPRYGVDLKDPSVAVRIDPDGTKTRGHFQGGRFYAD